MKVFVVVLISLLLIAFVAFNPRSEERVASDAALSVETVFTAAGLKLTDVAQKEIDGFKELFASQGFMSLYREVYRVSLDMQRYSFDYQMAAVTTLLLISQNEIDSGPLQSSGKRLFIHFCRLSLLDTVFALDMSQIARTHNLFAVDTVLLELWNDYLKQVWAKVVLPEVVRHGRVTRDIHDFTSLLPEFREELEKALAEHKAATGNGEDFFLKEGRSGSSESDYELRSKSAQDIE